MGNADLLAVTGNVTIDPTSTLKVTPEAGDYATAVVLPVLTATTIDGSFAVPSDEFPFLSILASQTPTSVSVTLGCWSLVA